MTYTISDALLSLKPNAEWNMNGTEYSSITWLDSSETKPTEDEVTAEIERLNNGYQAKRKTEYPKFEDQFDQIYNEGIDAWKATIKTIKDKYPKP